MKKLLVLALLALAAGITALAGWGPGHQASAEGTTIHFKCYKVRHSPGTPRFEPLDLFLYDQFGYDPPHEVEARKITSICNGVYQTLEGQGGGEVEAEYVRRQHMVCYSVREARSADNRDVGNLDVGNKFGLQTLTVGRLQSLCVSAYKNESSSGNDNYFTCYSAKTARGTPRFVSRDVYLDDQWDYDKDAKVLRPVSFCTPLWDKYPAGLEAASGALGWLTCYAVRQPRIPVIKDVHFFDQFSYNQLYYYDEWHLDILKAETLCVPTEKKSTE
jgi:hypothetical protein